ncbi:hypothetical protein GCM10010913_20290 [Paenibacillus aceti]|uniref:Gram-positive cocci surface proteins LPxTG domain-containing protein n=1 Tax=Paenibacillus aceti TaxID=1820010 RepID=A0ABQ1VTL9_9BACL|nr:hypothetical protein [Paenibacillus aceti]GGF98426.1 hypothetical protein GCM10010913_20290 [Paenibacillus aceti]
MLPPYFDDNAQPTYALRMIVLSSNNGRMTGNGYPATAPKSESIPTPEESSQPTGFSLCTAILGTLVLVIAFVKLYHGPER